MNVRGTRIFADVTTSGVSNGHSSDTVLVGAFFSDSDRDGPVCFR
nr:hypothetical protein asmbl_19 [uncultured bacterium]